MLYKTFRLTILVFFCHFVPQVLYAQPVENLTTGPPKGHLIIAGGALRDTSVFNLFIRLAGGPAAPVVIIPTAADDGFFASSDSVGVHIDLELTYKGMGLQNITILHTRDPGEADSDAFTAPIREATGVWFPGGRQWRLARNRQFDMFEILRLHPNLLGIGLDENTAIYVHGNEFEVLGFSNELFNLT